MVYTFYPIDIQTPEGIRGVGSSRQYFTGEGTAEQEIEISRGTGIVLMMEES